MLKGFRMVVILAGCLTWCAGARGQMVVHAVSGTVKSIDLAAKRMSVAVEGGSTEEFATRTKSDVALVFDSDLRGDAMDASKFDSAGDFVVVYYYGYGNNRTAVAVKDLGKSAEKTTGTVVDFDKRDHKLTVRKSDESKEVFRLSNEAVIDTGLGLESGRKYHPRNGTRVRVASTTEGGQQIAAFVWSRRSGG